MVQARGRVSQGMARIDLGGGGEGDSEGSKGRSSLVKSGDARSSSACGASGEIFDIGVCGCGEEMKNGRRRFVRRAVVAKRIMERVP